MTCPEGREGSEGACSRGAAGAEALVGVLKIIKNASYNKTRESPWWAMEKRPPFGGCATTFPLVQGALWVLCICAT